jgi:hypothetical protein
MLSVIELNVVMLSVIVLNVVMLSVVAPCCRQGYNWIREREESRDKLFLRFYEKYVKYHAGNSISIPIIAILITPDTLMILVLYGMWYRGMPGQCQMILDDTNTSFFS